MLRWFAAAAAGLVLLAGCTSRTDGEPSGSAAGQEQGPDNEPGTGPEDQAPDLSRFEPSEDNPDPSKDIEGVEVVEYEPGMHTLSPTQRVAYDRSPPFGGAHAGVWADCQGTVYDEAVRLEEMVHSLEHGTVWIAYNADELSAADVDVLAEKVDGQPYLMLSPFPELDRPISLQAWGHQLKLESVDDPRLDQFIAALRENQYTTPEPGARCDSQDTGFDVTDPPAFEFGVPGPGSMPVDGS
jgi:hypothetical protein